MTKITSYHVHIEHQSPLRAWIQISDSYRSLQCLQRRSTGLEESMMKYSKCFIKPQQLNIWGISVTFNVFFFVSCTCPSLLPSFMHAIPLFQLLSLFSREVRSRHLTHNAARDTTDKELRSRSPPVHFPRFVCSALQLSVFVWFALVYLCCGVVALWPCAASPLHFCEGMLQSKYTKPDGGVSSRTANIHNTGLFWLVFIWTLLFSVYFG